MEILKGKVQDPGFPDVECTYLKTDDGAIYVFIQDGKLDNGNIIATPILKEGIGHAPYTSLGLITPNGQVLIPFENKNIKPLKDNLLLVERTTPQTESVVDASSKQSDPLSAGTFIENTNTIKEQLKSVVGPTGEYIFDNIFSEAALYTKDGANVGGNYYSFIAKDSDSNYFMCSNVVGESIIKFDAKVQENDENTNEDVNNVTENSELNNEDTTSTNETQTENTQINDDQNRDVAIPSVDIPAIAGIPAVDDAVPPQVEVETPENEVSEEKVDIEFNAEESNLNEISSEVPIVPNVENSNVEQPTTSVEVDSASSEEGQLDIELPEINQPSETEDVNNVEETTPVEDVSEEEQEESEEIESDSNNVFDEENNKLETESEENDIFATEEQDDIFEQNNEDESTNVEEESDENYEEESAEGGISENNEEFKVEENTEEENVEEQEEYNEEDAEIEENDYEDEMSNPVIIDATNTIRKLLEENRKQRQIIDRQESEIDTLNSSNEILREDNDSKSKEIISLRNSMSKYRNQNTSLTKENNRLKNTTSRQEEIIDHLKTQNVTLKEQVAGIKALGNAVAEANTIFAPEVDDDYSNDTGYGYLDEDTEGYQYTKKAA